MMDPRRDLEYYTKINRLQEFLREREDKRMELDQEFSKYTKSDETSSLTRASRLQAYWKQLCEREKTSRARNQKLLQEFDRVEAHVAALAIRTDRLRSVQEQYQRQVNQMYPNWRQNYEEKLRHHQRSGVEMQSQLEGRSKTYDAEHPLTSAQQHQTHWFPTHEDNTTRPKNASHDQLPVSPPNLPTQPAEQQRQRLEPNLEPRLDSQRHHSLSQLSQKGSEPFEVSVPSVNGEGSPHSYQGRAAIQGGMPQRYNGGRGLEVGLSATNQRGTAVEAGLPQSGNELEIERHGTKSPPRGISHSDQRGAPRSSQPDPAVQDISGYEIPIGKGTVAHRQIFGSPSKQQRRTSLDQGGDVSSRTEPFSSASEEDSQEGDDEQEQEEGDPAQRALMGIQRQSQVEEEDEMQSPEPQEAVQNETGKERPTEGTSPTPGIDRRHVEAPLAAEDPEPEAPSRLKEDSDKDFESDLSLPLSEDEAHSSPIHEPYVRNGPELTTNGYLHLLQELENIIERSDQQISVYDGERCAQDQKSCIIEDANAKLSLNTYNALSLSSVLIQELPLLVRASPRGYLISDQVLKSERPILEVTVRSAITTNALPYWDRTLKHMVFLIKREYFEPEEIAEKVAPLMVSKDSVMAEKAVRVVTSLLEDAAEEPTLDESSMTQTSVEETPASAAAPTATEEEENERRGENKVPPLDLNATGELKGSSDESDDDDGSDSFFDQDVPLKETDAYKQMLQGMQPKKSGRDEDRGENAASKQTKDAEDLLAELEESSGEDDDDIEKAAMVSPPNSGRSSGGRPKRNVLSSLGGSDMFDQVKEDEGKKETGMKSLTPRDRSGEMSSPEKSDIISSASETPREGGGYVPSAMDNSLKSSGRRSEGLQRSSAFWGEESDLDEVESEMSVPMGTSGADDKDDFDFYD